MSERYEELTIRRILVALDASRHSLAALEAAAELAASLEAELQGLFVEDINLLRVAGTPVAREVRYPFVTAARLDRTRMERELRAQATQARQALAAACERRQIRWSFRVVRGEVAPEVLAAALDADLLSLGKASRPLIRRVRLGSTARAAAAQAPKSVLLLQRDVSIKPPVMVAYDGSPTAQQALRIATHLAQEKGGSYLAVLVVADTLDEEYRLQAETADWLRRQKLLIRYRRLADAGVATLTREVQSEGSGVLVLGSTILPLEALQVLLNEVDCPVLLVR
ncbi:MAG: universal stress protein [Anaerolineae bacterium]